MDVVFSFGKSQVNETEINVTAAGMKKVALVSDGQQLPLVEAAWCVTLLPVEYGLTRTPPAFPDLFRYSHLPPRMDQTAFCVLQPRVHRQLPPIHGHLYLHRGQLGGLGRPEEGETRRGMGRGKRGKHETSDGEYKNKLLLDAGESSSCGARWGISPFPHPLSTPYSRRRYHHHLPLRLLLQRHLRPPPHVPPASR